MSRGRKVKRKNIKENRLERARLSIAEQRERAEQAELKQKDRMMKRVQWSTRPAEPCALSVAFAIVLSLILGMGFTGMLVTTHSFSVNYYGLLFGIGILSFACAYCHLKGTRSTPILLGSFLVLLSGALFYTNLFHVRNQWIYVYSILKINVYHGLTPIVSDMKELLKMKGPVTILMLIFNIVPVYLTTYMVIRRRPFFLAVIPYLPFLLSSTLITYIRPDPWSGELVVGGLLVLLVYQYIRRLGDERVDDRMLKITAPLVLLCMLIGSIFPAEGYDRDELAKKQFSNIQATLRDIGSFFHVGDPEARTEYEKEQMIKEQGYKGMIIMGEENGQLGRDYEYTEDLSQVGYFDPPDRSVLEVTRSYNDMAGYSTMVSAKLIYLRVGSMEVFEKNTWKTYQQEGIDDDLRFFSEDSDLPESEAGFVVQVHTYVPMEVYFVPAYVDHFHVSPESRYSNLGIPVRVDWDLSECVMNPDGEKEYNYAYNMTPQKLEVEWDPKYLEEEVYGVCLSVPEETKKAILDSQILPSWFHELLDGTREMTTAEKVGAVIEYVRTVHPYDAMTPFPPQGADFVTWFLKDSKSGFCVHYATTAAVLLRMLGVPTRYTTGYLVSSDASGITSRVSMKNAHAWLEFFDPEYGWVIDDPTPGNALPVSYFNAYSIAKEYGDMVYDYHLTPTPRPKATPKPTRTPVPSPTPEKTQEEKVREVVFSPILITIFVLVLSVFLLRILYVLFWKIRFRSSSTNARAKAYMQYFAMHGRILPSSLSRVAASIYQKAEYSDEPISEEELARLIRYGKHNLSIQRIGRPAMHRALSRILDVRI